jgi:hypothetical protein
MAPPLSSPHDLTASLQPVRKQPGALMLAAVMLAAVLLLGALGLWFHYGTEVFFEMIASGFAACL